MILVRGGRDGEDINAYLQPLRYKNKMYLDSQYTKLGIMDESSFLLIASAELNVNEYDDFLVDGSDHYSFVKAEVVFCLNKPAYTWAILRKKGW